MTTITAVELRKNFESILKRVMAGEDIRVTYRQQPAVRLTSDIPQRTHTAGLDAFLAAPRRSNSLRPDTSFKQLYHEHLEGKYGRYSR